MFAEKQDNLGSDTNETNLFCKSFIFSSPFMFGGKRKSKIDLPYLSMVSDYPATMLLRIMLYFLENKYVKEKKLTFEGNFSKS